MASYFIVGFASIIYAFLKLCKPSMSKESQRLVLVRHVLCILGFTIAQMYVFLSFVWMIDPKKDFGPKTKTFVNVCKLFFEAQGIYLPLLRLSEPFFF